MKSASAFIAALLVAAPALAQSGTWTGQISDSMCKAKHEEAAEGAGKMPDKDCTLSCVKGGSKFVLLVDGKVYQIANQDNKDLAAVAGQSVKVSGDLKGDTITVAKIEKP
jgi:archaellum component FlaG (FlaF/FlaG flagellin family)